MEPLEFINTESGESPRNAIENSLHMSQHPSEFPNPGKTKSEKCNLRKSLAWDSAFFTSAGVLDPDELSSMMEGVKINDNHSLPTIPEDLRVSGDSISTLESDCLDLDDTTDADIFCDIRASIQKSSRPSKTVNSVIKPCPFLNDIEDDDTIISPFLDDACTRKMDVSSPNKLQVKLKTRSKSFNLKGSSEKMVKQAPVHPVIPQPVSKKGTVSPFLKPAKQLSKPPLISATRTMKTVPSVTNNDKAGNGSTGKGPSILKVPASGTSSKSDTRGKFLSKSFLGYSTTKPEPTTSCSSNECSEAPRKTKVPSNSLRKKTGGKPYCAPPSSDSIPKAPSAKPATLRYKSQSGTSNIGNFLKSAVRTTQSISPASSISEWSCESSSSSSVNQKCNKSKVGSGSTSLPNKRMSTDVAISQVSEGVRFHNNQPSNLASTRPSGLRMPSPKIGFFDGVKSTGCAPPKGNAKPSTCKMSSTTTTSLSRNATTDGRNPNGDSIKGNLIKPARTEIPKPQKSILSTATSRSPKDVRSHIAPTDGQNGPLKNERNTTHHNEEKCFVSQDLPVTETVSANSIGAQDEGCGDQLMVDPLMSGTKICKSSSVNDNEEINGCQKVDKTEIRTRSPHIDQVMGGGLGLEEPQNSTTKASQFGIFFRSSEVLDASRVPLASKNSLGNANESPDFPISLPEDPEKASASMPYLQISCDENAEFYIDV